MFHFAEIDGVLNAYPDEWFDVQKWLKDGGFDLLQKSWKQLYTDEQYKAINHLLNNIIAMNELKEIL